MISMEIKCCIKKEVIIFECIPFHEFNFEINHNLFIKQFLRMKTKNYLISSDCIFKSIEIMNCYIIFQAVLDKL